MGDRPQGLLPSCHLLLIFSLTCLLELWLNMDSSGFTSNHFTGCKAGEFSLFTMEGLLSGKKPLLPLLDPNAASAMLWLEDVVDI